MGEKGERVIQRQRQKEIGRERKSRKKKDNV